MTQNLTSERIEEIIEQVLDLAGSPEEILTGVVELLHQNMPNWNWVGIYYLVGDQLHLGPFAGAPTEHEKIAVGTGVCGSAVKENSNIIVDDVTQRENYLACSAETKSEIVVLIREKGKVVAQFDVDSNVVKNFTADDEKLLEEVADIVASYCNVLASKMA